MNVPNKTRSGERRSHNGVIACCDHCGFPIYSPDDAVIVEVTDEIIHVQGKVSVFRQNIQCVAKFSHGASSACKGSSR